MVCTLGSEEPVFLKKKPNPLGFGVLLFWALLGFFGFIYLNEQLGSLLVDLAYQLTFYLDSPVLYLKIHKFITYWLLEDVNVKKY